MQLKPSAASGPFFRGTADRQCMQKGNSNLQYYCTKVVGFCIKDTAHTFLAGASAATLAAAPDAGASFAAAPDAGSPLLSGVPAPSLGAASAAGLRTEPRVSCA